MVRRAPYNFTAGRMIERSAGSTTREPRAVVNIETATIQPTLAMTRYSEKSSTRKPRPTANALDKIARDVSATAFTSASS